MPENKDICPVCGYEGLSSPAYYPDEWGSPSEETCPSCGTQFGYDDGVPGGRYDATKRAARHGELRQKWIAGGMRWWRSEIYWWNVNVRFGGSPPPGWGGGDRPLPDGWDPVAQLQRLEQRTKEAKEAEELDMQDSR